MDEKYPKRITFTTTVVADKFYSRDGLLHGFDNGFAIVEIINGERKLEKVELHTFEMEDPKYMRLRTKGIRWWNE